MANSFVVSTVFKAKDRVSSAFKKMSTSAKIFGRKSDEAFDKASRSAKDFKGVTKGILKADVIRFGFNQLRTGARAVTEEFVRFDDKVTAASAKFPEKIGRGTKEFEALRATVRQVGAETQFSAGEAAEGLEFLAMAGFSADAAMKALPITVDLATAANTDLARATDIASDALGAFGLASDNAEEQTANLTRINDVFAATVTSANVDMENLFETMVEGGPVLTSAGQSMETFAALTGVMGNAGIKGSKAGTTLKNAILQLEAATPGATKKLKELNVNVEDQDGNMRDIIDILEDYRQATADMGTVQRDAATDLIFGKRAIAGVNVLLEEGGESLKEYRDKLINSKGAAKEMADTMRQSLGNRLKALKSAAIELGFKFLEAFEKDGKQGIEALIEAVRNFDPKPIIEGLKSFLGIAKEIFGFVKDNWSIFKPLLIGIAAVKMTSLAGEFAGLTGGINSATGATGGLLSKINMVSGASTGALAAVGGVLGAGAGGYAVGTALREAAFEPAIERQASAEERQRKAVGKAREAVRYGDLEAQQRAFKELMEANKALADDFDNLETGAGLIASLFADVESPTDKMTRKMDEARRAAELLREAMTRAASATPRAAPNEGTTNGATVNGTILVETAEGTRAEVVETPGASSPVDIEKAGQQ